MRYFFILAAALGACCAANADMLVWKNGVRMEIAETWVSVKNSPHALPPVSMRDREGRTVRVWVRATDIDWDKTRIASEHAAAFGRTLEPTVGGWMEGEIRREASTPPPPAPGIRVLDVKGELRFGHAYVSGRVVNGTEKTLRNIRVRARLLDRRGRVLVQETGDLKGGLKTLMPGQEAAFDVLVSNVGTDYVETYEAEVLHD